MSDSTRCSWPPLFAAIVLLLMAPGPLSAQTNLVSVDWVEQGTPPTSSLGGVFRSGALTFGSVSGTTDRVFNAGSVREVVWGARPFSAGYTTSVNEGVALAASRNSARSQTFLFTEVVSTPHLFVNFLDVNTSFDFGAYNWTVLGANNASRSGSRMVVGSGATDTTNDGFLVRINQTFGPGTNLSFSYINDTSVEHSVRFTVASVPEPSTYAQVAVAVVCCGGWYVRCRRKQSP